MLFVLFVTNSWTECWNAKIFTDQELEQMIDPILDMDDKNRDGYIDYPEFVAAQKSRGFRADRSVDETSAQLSRDLDIDCNEVWL